MTVDARVEGDHGLSAHRVAVRVAVESATADVLITTYDEPPGLVQPTARAAKAIRHPHQTWILDDGNRPPMRAVAQEPGETRVLTNRPWQLVGWQLAAAVALVGCLLLALVRLSAGPQELIPTAFNVVWVVFDLAALSVLIGAVRYRGYLAEEKN